MIDLTKKRDELKKLAEKATPGKWEYVIGYAENVEVGTGKHNPEWDKEKKYPEFKEDVISGCGCCGSPSITMSNVEYITAANPAVILKLLDDLEIMRQALEKYADSRNWINSDASLDKIMFRPASWSDADKNLDYLGGKTAREVLSRIGAMGGEK